MSKQTFKTVYKILFLLDSINIATYIVCVACDVYSEQRKLIGMLLLWLVLLWFFLFNKAFGGIGAMIHDITGRDFYPFGPFIPDIQGVDAKRMPNGDFVDNHGYV